MNSVGITERLNKFPSVYAAAQKAMSLGLRVAMPGTITKVQTNQLVTVQLNITENVNVGYAQTVPTVIPPIPDVLLMVPSDLDFSLTFPSLVNCEVLVIFADLCISGWWNLGGIQNQERIRRHSFNDGFAILSPKSKGNVIPNYSTTHLELKANNGHAKVSMDTSGNLILEGDTSLQLNSPNLELVNAPTPVPISAPTSYTNISASLPIKINGVTYYIKLSTTP